MKGLIGKRSGMLVVLERLKGSKVLCLCDCGNNRTVSVGHFNTGNIKSCGCHVVRHNKYGSREYICWSNMIQRCHNKKNKRFDDYGKKGIKVCSRWRKSFTDFYYDMGDCPEGYQIDRKDNREGYSPDNCQWATPKQNMGNRELSRVYIIDGVEFKSSVDAAEALNVNQNTILAWCNGRKTNTFSKRKNKMITRSYDKKTGCFSKLVYKYLT